MLPIDDVLDEVVASLRTNRNLVLQAPPGAGKTTRVPLALLEAEWLDGRIVMLEPRRVAARATAQRLAASMGERVGGTVGLRMRGATEVGRGTAIEVVTEGVLTQMLQSDPELDGVGCVIFDEFHERSLHADVGLAFTLESQAALRVDLRVVVMSATLDGERVAALLDAPVITSAGRQYPVETSYRPAASGLAIERHLVDVVTELLAQPGGDILCFLPGAGWIRRAERDLGRNLPDDVVVTPLYGLLGSEQQDQAIRPDPAGRRKVILSTDIAETSLTIDGVDTVVDGGLRRAPVFDPRSGLSRLETVRISGASADQRRGRAGRQGPGTCVRLWSPRDQETLRAFDRPEIAATDLTGLRLELARWGADAGDLTWLDVPPASGLDEAARVLARLGVLDHRGRITPHGREVAELGTHPRLAHMIVKAGALGHGALACDVAGLLSSRDPLETRSADLAERVRALGDGRREGVRWGAMQEARQAARRWRRQRGHDEAVDLDAVGLVVSLAFPDRIAQRRGTSNTYLLVGGRGAELPAGDALTGADWLAIAEVDGEPEGGRIFLAAPLDRSDVERAHAAAIERVPVVAWDRVRGDVVAEHQTALGAIVLKREPMHDPDPHLLAAAWGSAVEATGLGALTFSAETDRWRQRVGFLRATFGDEWPAVDDETLHGTIDEWLVPHLSSVRRRRDLAGLDTAAILRSLLTWDQQRMLDELAPTHLTVPSGSAVRLDYADPEAPVLAVRLQELFGLTTTPTVAAGRVPLTIHLLSPAQRPVQVTRDLANFWAETYDEVKAELKGRYPKHHWPDDPLTATPTNRTKRRGSSDL